MKHPALAFAKHVVLNGKVKDEKGLLSALSDRGILLPLPGAKGSPTFFETVSDALAPIPAGLLLKNPLHRPTVRFLRDHGIYDLQFPTPASLEALGILSERHRRKWVETLLLSPRTDRPKAIRQANQQNGWSLTADGVEAFRRIYWDTSGMAFEEVARFLHGRDPDHEARVGVMRSDRAVANHYLGLESSLDSKSMILRAQQVAFALVEEVASEPGASADKISRLSKAAGTVVMCHEALTTADAAMEEVLEKFTQLRMRQPAKTPKSIHEVSVKGLYSGSGKVEELVPHAPVKTEIH